MQAANTGHQVMTTVHANTNLLALKRLESLNVNPFLLATTVKLILGQRLVRKLCSACAMPSDGDSDRLHVATLLKDNGYSAHATWADFGLDATDLQDGLNVLPAMSRKGDYEHAPNPTDRIIDYRGLRHPRGCNQCQGTGYSGRVAVFQVIPISRALRLSILARESIDKWEAIAFEEGSRTLFANGLLRVLRGATSLGGIIAALGPGYERGTPL
jgi:type II secretory ATPase GspE/PulE/Tfp pilus assembly ATPase PilB-like protein